MKVAISSASFAHLLAAGDLTQLEWLERCAATLGADGVVFERSHFPRTDREYTAQLRKISIDMGLVPLAVDDPELFTPDRPASERLATVELAAGLGALFGFTVLPPKGAVPPAAFVAAVEAAKSAVRAAKSVNLTLLAGTAAGTLGEDIPGLRHFAKDVDSAWLGYLLPAGTRPDALRSRDRVHVVTVDPADDLASAVEVEEDTRPWLLLRGPVDRERVAGIRRAAAKKTLAIAGVS